jgi:DNA-binding NtrC family response regulator
MTKGQRVLVVDDEEDILATIADYLGQEIPGLKVTTARNGLAGWDALQKEPADLVLSDYRMPVMDGLTLLERVSRKWPDVPTVLITAFPDLQVAMEAINRGHVRQFMTKPLAPDDLLETVRTLLEQRLAKQQRDAALDRASKA